MALFRDSVMVNGGTSVPNRKSRLPTWYRFLRMTFDGEPKEQSDDSEGTWPANEHF